MLGKKLIYLRFFCGVRIWIWKAFLWGYWINNSRIWICGESIVLFSWSTFYRFIPFEVIEMEEFVWSYGTVALNRPSCYDTLVQVCSWMIGMVLLGILFGRWRIGCIFSGGHFKVTYLIKLSFDIVKVIQVLELIRRRLVFLVKTFIWVHFSWWWVNLTASGVEPLREKQRNLR